MSTRTKLKVKKRSKKRGPRYAGKKILRILSAAAQSLDDFGNFAYNPHPYIYSSLGHVYSKETIDDAVDDLIKEGLVEKSETKGLRLALAGTKVKEKLIRLQEEEWDGQWRVVFFDIPEARRSVRDDLRAELKKLGFGLWQRSAWITPFDIAEELGSYLQKADLSVVVQVLVGERVGKPDDRELAREIWSLDEINKKYKTLLGDWGKEIKKEQSGEERLAAAAKFHRRYLDILEKDPRLPKQLLPDGWLGDQAKKLFKKLRSTLAKGKAF